MKQTKRTFYFIASFPRLILKKGLTLALNILYNFVNSLVTISDINSNSAIGHFLNLAELDQMSQIYSTHLKPSYSSHFCNSWFYLPLKQTFSVYLDPPHGEILNQIWSELGFNSKGPWATFDLMNIIRTGLKRFPLRPMGLGNPYWGLTQTILTSPTSNQPHYSEVSS